MKNSETKCHIEVEGVVLTTEAIITLVDLQSQDNYNLKEDISNIKDIICWIVSILNELDEHNTKIAIDMMGRLNYLKTEFDGLKKP